ncbi:MAG: putative circadian clock protein KaiC [Panacagrimonas sp.]|jgi:circadian clock protein KaiC|nr:ATPase domain-containing protein [Panacagrimonas sp.]MCC2658224.1 putative circadian clock protein KaiC [Panacagrimonas sp.]
MDTAARTLSTGIPGLDDVLAGGLTRNRVYLVEGVPGSGKTTLALQFLLEGKARGESTLYITLSESSEELNSIAESHGWDLDGIQLRELSPSAETLRPDDQYTLFHPSEVELGETTRAILEEVERTESTRIVFDSLAELRLIAGNSLRYRRQVLALKQFFAGRQCTVLWLDDLHSTDRDLQVQSIAHGVIALEQLHPDYGAERRRLRIIKYRGVKFRGGYHDYLIRRGGLQVFPRLVASETRTRLKKERFASGIAELDQLMGGGIERGTSTLIAGAAGTGKSSIAAQFVHASASRGQKALMLIFDEATNTLLDRASELQIGLRDHVDRGHVAVMQIDPAELSPGELVDTIRKTVTEDGVSMVVIDSLNGFLNAMPGERHLLIQLHELLMFLGQRGVATLLISAQHGLIGSNMRAPVDVSYLADAVVLMRYFEAEGRVRQAISILKKRGGAHERTIREFSMAGGRLAVGAPLLNFRGILTGVPVPVAPAENRDDATS